eukprot:GHRR01008305.1.p1 GENE.GHRR01008305.1~~GHRR01008305.1.p1  ORF type:complete len:285 (+),score=98.02 GHRR01008305.1:367-1221(+)
MLRASALLCRLARCHAASSAHCRFSSVSQELYSSELQQQLLDAAVKHVKRYGWSRASLTAAASELQLSPACVGMFPRGGSELIEHVIRQHNNTLATELQANQQRLLAMPVSQRIATAVRRRLEMNIQFIDTWPQALAMLAQPRNSAAALQLLAQLLDDIWYAAGDTSTDYNWYTKRGLLAAIYTSTELYMLTDFSPGYQDTWQQLERRIKDALWLGRVAGRAAAAPQQVFDLVSVFVGSSTVAADTAPGSQATPTSTVPSSSSHSTGMSVVGTEHQLVLATLHG